MASTIVVTGGVSVVHSSVRCERGNSSPADPTGRRSSSSTLMGTTASRQFESLKFPSLRVMNEEHASVV
jgi:hypothetical protein